MNGKKAKALRKQVFTQNEGKRRHVKSDKGQVVALGLRGKYQAVKKYGAEGVRA